MFEHDQATCPACRYDFLFGVGLVVIRQEHGEPLENDKMVGPSGRGSIDASITETVDNRADEAARLAFPGISGGGLCCRRTW